MYPKCKKSEKTSQQLCVNAHWGDSSTLIHEKKGGKGYFVFHRS
jgi:hypothetical protein